MVSTPDYLRVAVTATETASLRCLKTGGSKWFSVRLLSGLRGTTLGLTRDDASRLLRYAEQGKLGPRRTPKLAAFLDRVRTELDTVPPPPTLFEAL